MAKALFGKKKKAADPAAPAEQKGPVVTMLDASQAEAANPRRKKGGFLGLFGQNNPTPRAPTILSDRLGA